jgi:lysylphosphatidylglycerol synthetase-like protein (DUF2156 family)
LHATTRPLGVTLLAILKTLLGILELLGAATVAFANFVLPDISPRLRFLSPRSAFSGLGLVVLALAEFILAYGLWRGMGWAWVGSLILAVIGLVFSAFTLFMRPRVGEIIALLLNAVVTYYLITASVQSFFGKGKHAIVAPSSYKGPAGP